MLTAYKHDENHRLCSVAFEEMEKGSWINCAAPDAAELEKLNELTGIPVDSLQTALDREERSHVELEDDFIFVVVIRLSSWRQMLTMHCRWGFLSRIRYSLLCVLKIIR